MSNLPADPLSPKRIDDKSYLYLQFASGGSSFAMLIAHLETYSGAEGLQGSFRGTLPLDSEHCQTEDHYDDYCIKVMP